jgi:hypothetical protein
MKTRNISITIILAIAFIAGICMPASAATFTPKAGLYYVQSYDKVTFHTYTTPIKFAASTSVVIETPNSLILQDVQQNKPNNMDLKALIASLNKPLKRIYLSHNHDHHWIGLEDFPGVPVYANAATIATIKTKGAEMLAEAKKKFSEKMVPYTEVPVPQNVIKMGEELIDGVKFVHSSPIMGLTGPVNFMEFPDQKVLIHHHLAYNGVHVPMGAIEFRMAALTFFQGKGYDYIIAGHGIPSGSEAFFNATLDYYAKLDEAVKGSADPAGAKAKMMQAYPEWGGVFLLDALLPMHYKK